MKPMLKAVPAALVCASLVCAPLAQARDADKTKYPIVFAHGMAGFNNILGLDYWGDDFGTYVLDPCDKFLEIACNGDINDNQQSYVSAVQPFHSSEVRGKQLADNIESYMATTGNRYVNLVSHSQGGVDSRKAARVLYERKGYRVVKTHVSVSSPHRGSPVAKFILDNFRDSIVEVLANFYGNVVYAAGNDAVAGAKQLVYDDYEADGVTTGMKAFNQNYPASGAYIEHAASVMTAQSGLNVNPALWLVSEGLFNIDGNGYCLDDCNHDGAAGQGDGDANQRDDDGLVGINSQQQGERLQYYERWGSLDSIYAQPAFGYVSDLNRPSELQSTSLAYVLNQDHIDVIGVGPDTFDEMEFYAAITDYIADRGH
ncbi:acetyltransferase [Hahella sp. CR1]|uniref:esterase/lipase family protein n=1 Tax=Hahella sp. CR1 TaxID=2992807 RepID=UPI0024432AAE|nr:acetyltransferase [Hahella sp. CR1]MDG9666660.1 acetyltransferase [Hahella sp. CR1]